MTQQVRIIGRATWLDRVANEVVEREKKLGRSLSLIGVELVKRVGIKARETNNIVERLHETPKESVRQMRGLTKETARTLLDGCVIKNKYIRDHQSIKMTPAQKAGIQITNGWRELIERATKEEAKTEVQDVAQATAPIIKVN